VTEDVIPTTSIRSGPVKNMREKLGNRIHSFRCTTYQEISRDEMKRLEPVLKGDVSTSTVAVPENCIIDRMLLLSSILKQNICHITLIFAGDPAANC
jgi:hypothetical protein